MSATYTRKGSYTRSVIKTLLGADTIFSTLSDDVKNALIDIGVQRIASLRNSLSKPDYLFDTTGSTDVLAVAVGFSKYIRFVFIDAGQTYNGQLYPSDTILLEQSIGWTSDPTTSRTRDIVTITSSSGEFVAGAIVVPSDYNIGWTRDSNSQFTVDLTNSPGVVVFVIYYN